MGTFDMFANVVLLTPRHHADKIFLQVSAVVNLEEQRTADSSELPNDAGFVFKVLGQESQAGSGQGARVLVYCPPNGDRSTGIPKIRVALTFPFVARKEDLGEGRRPVVARSLSE